MGSIAPIGGYGTGLSQAEFVAQYQVAVMKKQLDVMQEMGELALQLIQSAPLAPSSGATFDVRV